MLTTAHHPRRLRGLLTDVALSEFHVLARREPNAPLSVGQERMWLTERLSPGTCAHHLSEAYRVRGDLDRAALSRAFDALVTRHTTLRTTVSDVDDRPIQVVFRYGRFPLEEIDLRRLSPDRRADELAQRCVALAERPFDLEHGPLVRAQLIQLADDEHLVQVALHGLVADEASLAILWDELGALYRIEIGADRMALAPLAIEYGDFAAWHRRFVDDPALAQQRAYWAKTFEGGLPTLRLPYDHRQRSAPASPTERVEMPAEADCLDQLLRIGAADGRTPFVALMTAYVAFLHRYSGDRTIAAGYSVPGRTLPESEALIGSFSNTVLLATHVAPGASFIELMREVAARESDAYDHQDVPIEHLMRALRARGQESRIQAAFRLRHTGAAGFSIPGATTTLHETFCAPSLADLSFEVRDGETPVISAQYVPALFKRQTVERMIANFVTLLRGIAADPERPIGALPILSEAERRTVLVEWNATEAPRHGTQCLHRLIEAQVSLRRTAPAIVYEGGSVAYDELDRRANKMARALRALGVSRGSLVGVCVKRSVEAIVTLLAVAKAGGAFVPLDPAYPDERLAVMLGDAAPSVVVTSADAAPRIAPPSPSVTVTTIEELGALSALQPDGVLRDIVGPDDTAYVIYTSGSTGMPKGVVVSHRSACNMVLSARTDFQIDERDRVIALAPLSFDPSVWQILGTLALGACIVLPTSESYDAPSIVRDVVKYEVSVLIAVPALLALMFEIPELRGARALRLVVSGGSALTAALRDRCARMLGVPLHNVYGPTETTIHVTQHRCQQTDDGEVVPIGRPIENARAYILDEHRLPVPIGVAGELYIGGAAVANGYLRRPELTAERFVPDPFSDVRGARMYRTGDVARYRSDGNIEFLGREDDQVKVRGVRIELAEVEAAIKRHRSVATCAVVVQKRGDDERLVAFVVPREQQACDPTELRAHAREVLPLAAVPSVFVAIDTLPLLPNGKADRRALAERVFTETADPLAHAGSDSLHSFLAQVWEDVLGIEGIRISDDFFTLGGHSLLAARVLTRIEAAFGTRLPFPAFFADPTVDGLARAIRSEERGAFESIVAVQTAGDRTPFFFLHGDYTGIGLYARRFAGALGEQQPIYAIPPHGADGGEVPATIEEMAHDTLERVKRVQPTGPYLLGGYCLGGVVALEMARQLCALGDDVLHLVLIEAQATRNGFGYVEDAASALAGRVGIDDDLSRHWLASRRRAARRAWHSLRPPRAQAWIGVRDPATSHVEAAQERAVRSYVWRRVCVHATMLCARDDAGDNVAVIRRNWARLFETLDVRLIPGNHVTALTRNLHSLTAELRDILRCSTEVA